MRSMLSWAAAILPPRILPTYPTKALGGNIALEIVVILLVTGAVLLFGYCMEKCMRTKYGQSSAWNILLPAIIGILLMLRFDDPIVVLNGLLFCFLLLWAANSDIRTREVADELSVMVFIAAFIGVTISDLPSMILGAVIVSLPQLSISMAKQSKAFGGADIKLSAACGFLLGAVNGIAGVIIGLISAIVFQLIRQHIDKAEKGQPFALVPFLASGFMLAYFI